MFGCFRKAVDVAVPFQQCCRLIFTGDFKLILPWKGLDVDE